MRHLLWLLALLFLSPYLVESRYIDEETEEEDDTEEPLSEEYKNVLEQLYNSGLVFSWPSADVLDSLGAVSGVAVGPKEEIYLLQRGDHVWTQRTFNNKNEYTGDRSKPIREETILVFSSNLNHSGLKDAFGANMFYLPHGLTVDHDGNLWVTDVALHQVIKFPSGKSEPSLVLGEKFQPGSDVQHFCKPTSVAVAKNGDFFVADGYCNSRILKFDKNGRLLLMWGKPDNGDKVIAADELSIPHSLTLIEERDELCVADREHARVQCYNAGLKDPKHTGNLTATIDVSDLGAAYAVAYNHGRQLIGVLGGIRDGVARSDVGFYNVNTKKFVHKFSFPADEGFGDGHDLAFSPSGNRALVASINKVCPASWGELCDDPIINRNVWLFT